jgi:hypothetical protein
MTISTVKPGLHIARAMSPFTPIAVINGTPIYPISGGRSGGGVRIAVGDDDGTPDDDLLDDDDDEQDDEDDEQDDEQDLPAVMRGKAKPKAKTARRAADEDEDDEPDDEDEDDGTPGAIKRMEAALQKANKTAARYRRAGKAVERLGIDDLSTWLTERGIDPETGRPFGTDVVDPEDEGGKDDDTDDSLFEERPARRDPAKTDKETIRAIRAAEKRAEARTRAELVPILAQVSATNALRDAGFNGSPAKMEKILRLIDPDDLDVIVEDGTFEIEGLDDAIASIRDDFPELFPAAEPVRTRTTGTGRARTGARRASGAGDVDGGGRGRTAKKAQGGWIEQMVARMDAKGR